jgi:hypothetical protein
VIGDEGDRALATEMTLDRPRRPYAFPPRPAPPHRQRGAPAQPGRPEKRVRSTATDSLARHALAERLPLLAIPAKWTATAIMHAARMPGLWAVGRRCCHRGGRVDRRTPVR